MITIRTEDFNKREIGPHIFVKLLMHELEKQGKIKVVTGGADADLVFLYTKNEDAYVADHPDTPIVTRCGGVWGRLDWIKHMQKRWELASGLVFQSKFAFQEYQRVYGPPRGVPTEIIINGTDIQHKPQDQRTRGVVCSAAWRNTKRPWLVEELAKAMPDVWFTILGAFPIEAKENMTVVGQIPRKAIGKYLEEGSVFLHTGKKDPCPNALVEAIAAGLIPVASNSGGAPEIVQNSGWCYEEPPDIKQIAILLQGALTMEYTKPRPDLSIENVANKYYDFFIRVLEGKDAKKKED